MNADASTAGVHAPSQGTPQSTVSATPSPAHTAPSGLPAWLGVAMLSATVCALALGLYDQYVRQPRTPRLAVVDIAKLFAAAERSAKEVVLGPSAGVGAGGAGSAGARTASGQGATPAAELLAAANAAENFGPSVERVLGEISTECQCAIVAMAAVVGGNSTVPDYTQEAARRLGLLMRSPQSDRGAPQR
jgi:hypothetical protein